jgi:glycosyltransferase involved in cell wall biosynthesis
MSKIKILVVPSDRTGVSYFRSTKPHIALEQKYPDEFHIDIDYELKLEDESWLKQYDIIHFHRALGDYGKMEETMARIKKLGIPTIMDLDDYWSPGQHHPAYLLIKKNEIDRKIVNNLKLVDYVTTTTELFANEISKYGPKTMVLPNAIDPNEKQFIHNPEKSDRIRIGWLGGSSHLKDLELLKDLVPKLRGDGLMDKVQFVLCGFDTRGVITMIDQKTGKQTQRKITPKESVWYKYEKIFTDNYRTVSPEYKEFLHSFKKDEFKNVANEPYRRVWTKPISSYASNYNLFDISLAPLQENMFNKMKSQLKVIEAGFHKKAIVAQDFGPYQIDLENVYQRGGEIDTNGNAFLVNSGRNHKQWYKFVKKLITEPELITTLSDNLHKKISEEYSMDKVTEDRRNFYKSLVNV